MANRAYQAGDFDGDRQRSEHDTPGSWIEILSDAMFGNEVGLVAEVDLLQHRPLVQRDTAWRSWTSHASRERSGL